MQPFPFRQHALMARTLAFLVVAMASAEDEESVLHRSLANQVQAGEAQWAKRDDGRRAAAQHHAVSPSLSNHNESVASALLSTNALGSRRSFSNHNESVASALLSTNALGSRRSPAAPLAAQHPPCHKEGQCGSINGMGCAAGGPYPCCSRHGWCGTGADWCGSDGRGGLHQYSFIQPSATCNVSKSAMRQESKPVLAMLCANARSGCGSHATGRLRTVLLISSHAHAERIGQVLHFYTKHFAGVVFTHVKGGAWNTSSSYTVLDTGLVVLHVNRSHYDDTEARSFYQNIGQPHWCCGGHQAANYDAERHKDSFIFQTRYSENARVMVGLFSRPMASWAQTLPTTAIDGIFYSHSDLWLIPSRLDFNLRCLLDAKQPLIPKRGLLSPSVPLPCSVQTRGQCEVWAASTWWRWSAQDPNASKAPGFNSSAGVLAAMCFSVLDGVLDGLHPRIRDGRCQETLLPARKSWIDFWFLPRDLWMGYVSLARSMQRMGAFMEWAEATMFELLAGERNAPATLCNDETTCWGGCCTTLNSDRYALPEFLSNFTLGHRIDLQNARARSALAASLNTPNAILALPGVRPLRCEVQKRLRAENKRLCASTEPEKYAMSMAGYRGFTGASAVSSGRHQYCAE